MPLDLLAGTLNVPVPRLAPPPTILLFDSGVGGLTVFDEVRRARPDARIVYVADAAGFPYGALSEPDLVARCEAVIGRAIDRSAPDLVVVACNTASTLVLPHLRARFPIPFVGTVPAIKPATAASRSGLVTVLATPGTVARDYTKGLIDTYAGACRVELVGSRRLAEWAEAELTGDPASDEAIRAEIRPCFVARDGRRTDIVVLACTHYPLLLPRFRALAPWPVSWIDPAPAVARRVVQLIGGPRRGAFEPEGATFATTGSEAPGAVLARALAARGLATVEADPMPLARPVAH